MKAMFSHNASGGGWEERELVDCVALVLTGKAYECFDCSYDDDIRNFHCLAPCPICDEPEDEL